MGAVEIIALAASFSLLSGWRLYFSLLVAGLAMRFDLIALPDQLKALDALANPWVLGVAALGFVAEFFADKIAWLDSAWDGLHSVVRPIGGALLALEGSELADAHAPFDLVVLEAGDDGRVAGIGAGPDYEPAIAGPRGRRAVRTPTGMTLTKAAFDGTRSLMIVGRGADARAAVERAIADGPLSRAPVGRILADIEVDADILWSAE